LENFGQLVPLQRLFHALLQSDFLFQPLQAVLALDSVHRFAEKHPVLSVLRRGGVNNATL